MEWLVSGVFLWALIHFIPTLAPAFRETLIGLLGRKAYRGLFSLGILSALALIVLGWRSSPDVYWYVVPAWTRPIALFLMVFSIILFVAAQHATAIKRYVRHPQLSAVVLWSISHLLTNGTSRAFVLFAGLGAWALIEMPLISSRQGAWEKPASPGFGAELTGLAISAVAYIFLVFLHPYFAGVSPIPR